VETFIAHFHTSGRIGVLVLLHQGEDPLRVQLALKLGNDDDEARV